MIWIIFYSTYLKTALDFRMLFKLKITMIKSDQIHKIHYIVEYEQENEHKCITVNVFHRKYASIDAYVDDFVRDVIVLRCCCRSRYRCRYWNNHQKENENDLDWRQISRIGWLTNVDIIFIIITALECHKFQLHVVFALDVILCICDSLFQFNLEVIKSYRITI